MSLALALGQHQALLLAVAEVLEVAGGGAQHRKAAVAVAQAQRHHPGHAAALGDSHRGFAVLATTPAYFEHFRYGERQPLQLAQGRAFSGDLPGLYEVVLGAEVAQALGYRLGDKLTLSHGGGEMPGAEHADKPFSVAGILQRSGTPAAQSRWIASIAGKPMCTVRSTGVPVGARMPTMVNGLSAWSLACIAPSPWLSTMRRPSA